MSEAPTRRDDASVTRLDEPGAGGASLTRRDDAPGGGAGPAQLPSRSLFNLPQALKTDWTLVAPIPAHGAEAELFLVQRIGSAEQAVAKLYRPGIRPRSEALDRLAHSGSEHIVHILARGESEGITFELMEYCRFGSLRNLIEDTAADPQWLRAVLSQLADALAALHTEGVIHRDLKPENILVRSIEPPQLVLTDFGISSLATGTHHFTSTSRTVRYAPPEAMTGILTLKADYWSLGLILLEMYTGRHPFAGLSEAVINHQLITRPIDLSAVRDPAWRALMRGLLMRNPERRWSEPEVRAWLRGEIVLEEPGTTDEGIFVASVRPYEIGDARCSSARELAAALVARWDAGAKDLARGLVTAWLRDELRDQNLVRYVMDLMDDPSLTPDLRLLRFALRAAPQLPPVWRSASLSELALVAATRAALEGDAGKRDFLAGLYEQDALLMFPPSHPDAPRLLALRERWRRRADVCQQVQLRLAAEEQEARRQGGPAAGFADFDELLYGGPPELLRGAVPLPHGMLLAAEFAPDEISRLRQRVAAAMLEGCPWFRGSADPLQMAVEELAALDAAIPRVRRFAAEARARRSRLDEAARVEAAALRNEVDAMLRTARAFGGRSTSALNLRAGLQGVYETYQQLFARAHAESAAHPYFEGIRRTLARTGPRFLHIMDGIDRLDYLGRLRTLVLRDGWPFAAAMVVLPVVARLPALLGLELVICAGALGWYGYERAAALDRIRRYVGRLPGRVEDVVEAVVVPPAESDG